MGRIERGIRVIANMVLIIETSLSLHLLSSGTKVSLESLRAIATGCPRLRHFSLRESSDVSEKNLWEIFKGCHFLERVDIRGCPRVVGHLFRLANERLVSVHLERCAKLDDRSLAHLVAQCPKMTELDLSNCHALTPTGLAKIAEFPHLETLTMRQMNLSGPVSLDAIIRPEVLRHLDLSQNRCVTHTDLDVIYARCSELRHLNLSCCYTLNGLNFVRLSWSLRQLEYLNLSYVVVDMFGIPMPNPLDPPVAHLRELHLVAIPGFENRSLAYCLRLSALTSLDVSGNFELTNAAFAHEDPETEPTAIRVENELLRRRDRSIKIKIGGTRINRAELEASPELPYEFSTFDSSITSLRQDRHVIDYFDSDDSDYADDDSLGAGGDLDDFDYLDPVEEFERNWMS